MDGRIGVFLYLLFSQTRCQEPFLVSHVIFMSKLWFGVINSHSLGHLSLFHFIKHLFSRNLQQIIGLTFYELSLILSIFCGGNVKMIFSFFNQGLTAYPYIKLSAPLYMWHRYGVTLLEWTVWLICSMDLTVALRLRACVRISTDAIIYVPLFLLSCCAAVAAAAAAASFKRSPQW